MIFLETPRLLLRPIEPADVPGMLMLDSDPDVLRYVPNAPISTPAEALAIIEYIRAQYERNGVGRWAVIRKADGAFLGWSGLKLVDDAVNNDRTNYYDLGYRLLTRHWGQGYATEAAEAGLRYGFETLGLPVICATVMHGNHASQRILEKLGLLHTADFTEADGNRWHWYEKANPAPPQPGLVTH